MKGGPSKNVHVFSAGRLSMDFSKIFCSFQYERIRSSTSGKDTFCTTGANVCFFAIYLSYTTKKGTVIFIRTLRLRSGWYHLNLGQRVESKGQSNYIITLLSALFSILSYWKLLRAYPEGFTYRWMFFLLLSR